MNSTASEQSERFAIHCDMTIYHAEALKSELLGRLERNQVVELDLSQVAAIDTSGIQLLMLAKREGMKQNKELRIVAHSPAVSELMDFYNIAGFFGDPLVIPAQESSQAYA